MVFFTLNGMRVLLKNSCLTVVIGVALRCAVALHSYSGENQPPMYGDYEAQRHWMEITVNLPVKEWYRNSSDNDLQYWGLDYPPLAAYHSLLVGEIGAFFNKSYVTLFTSRGFESKDHKTFMRSSVLVSDLLSFYPAVVYYLLMLGKERRYLGMVNDYLFLALIYPGLILIDHGHFQYNCIPLGLTVAAVTTLFQEKMLSSAVLFSLSITAKQTNLFYALPFFVYMLRKTLSEKTIAASCKMLSKLGGTVVLVFFLVFCPFLLNEGSILDVFHRIFPVARGIFEDKVANAWCAINVVFKFKDVYSIERMLQFCTGTTLAFSMPSLVKLFLSPSKQQFLLSLINVSLAFFLFSFQVHEKSILLVAIPVMLYAPYDFVACTWFLVVTNISLLHLAMKDNLLICYMMLTAIFEGYICSNENMFRNEKRSLWWKVAISPTFFGSKALILGFLLIKPPSKYPDLWPLLNALFCFAHFLLFLVYFNYVQLFKMEKAVKRTSETKVSQMRRRKTSARQ